MTTNGVYKVYFKYKYSDKKTCNDLQHANVVQRTKEAFMMRYTDAQFPSPGGISAKWFVPEADPG